MFIKIIPFTAADPQRPCDLSGLLRYILTGRGGIGGADLFMRLAGPPFVRRVVQRVMPYGADFRLAAEDLAQQMFDWCKRGRVGRSLPRQVYAHIIVSFDRGYRSRKSPTHIPFDTKSSLESTYTRSLRIVLDTLEKLGVDPRLPLFFALHDDQRHLHAHVVVLLYAEDASDSLVHVINSSRIRAVAREIDLKYGLGRKSSALKARHIQTANPFITAHD